MDTSSSIAIAQAAACVIGGTWNIREPLTAIRSSSPTANAWQLPVSALTKITIPGNVRDADAGLYLELVHEPTSLILAATPTGSSPVELGDHDQLSEVSVALLVSEHAAASSVPWRSLSPSCDSLSFPSTIEHPALGPVVGLAVAHAKAPCSKRKQGPPGTNLSRTRTKQSTGSAPGRSRTLAVRPLVAAPVPTLLARILPRPPEPVQAPYFVAAPRVPSSCGVYPPGPSSHCYDGDASQMLWCDSSSQMAPSGPSASWRPDPGPGRYHWTPSHSTDARVFCDCNDCNWNDNYAYNGYNLNMTSDAVVTTQSRSTADGHSDSAALSADAADIQTFCPPVVALLVLPIYASSATTLSNPVLVPMPGLGAGPGAPLSALFTSSGNHPGLQVATDRWHALSFESSHIGQLQQSPASTAAYLTQTPAAAPRPSRQRQARAGSGARARTRAIKPWVMPANREPRVEPVTSICSTSSSFRYRDDELGCSDWMGLQDLQPGGLEELLRGDRPGLAMAGPGLS